MFWQCQLLFFPSIATARRAGYCLSLASKVCRPQAPLFLACMGPLKQYKSVGPYIVFGVQTSHFVRCYRKFLASVSAQRTPVQLKKYSP